MKFYPQTIFFILFATTYIYKSGYSFLVAIKTKSRIRFDVEDDVCVAVHNTVTNFKGI